MVPVLLGLLMGFGLPIQTAINSRLRRAADSPLFASLINFAVGTAFLLLVLVLSGRLAGLLREGGSGAQWWMWLGGALGFAFLTLNILLFHRLGSVETVIWPVVGQIMMALAIDTAGWLGAPRLPLGAVRVAGAVLVLAGVVLAVVLKTRRRTGAGMRPGARGGGRWAWRGLAVLAGAGAATQATINGALGAVLESPVAAAAVNFIVGLVILVVVVAALRALPRERGTASRGPRWMWLGGVLGGSYVLVSSALVPVLGTGTTMVLALLGQVVGSVCVDHFGWLGARRDRVVAAQLLGMALMVLGVVLVRFG